MTYKPSTAWHKQIADDEAERFAGYARDSAAMQRRVSARHGPGHALHNGGAEHA